LEVTLLFVLDTRGDEADIRCFGGIPSETDSGEAKKIRRKMHKAMMKAYDLEVEDRKIKWPKGLAEYAVEADIMGNLPVENVDFRDRDHLLRLDFVSRVTLFDMLDDVDAQDTVADLLSPFIWEKLLAYTEDPDIKKHIVFDQRIAGSFDVSGLDTSHMIYACCNNHVDEMKTEIMSSFPKNMEIDIETDTVVWDDDECPRKTGAIWVVVEDIDAELTHWIGAPEDAMKKWDEDHPLEEKVEEEETKPEIIVD